MTVAPPIDRFAVWRRRVHPVLLIVGVAFVVLVIGALIIPKDSRGGIPDDLVSLVFAPSIAAVFVILVGRSATFEVLKIPLPFFQAAAWIIFPAALLITVAIAESRLRGHSFFLEDFLMRTSAFPVWLVEQLAAATTFPFIEEVVFRGVIQTELKKRIGTIAAILVTATLFGFAHFDGTPDFLRIGILSWVGLVLCIVRERTDSLGASIAVHGLYNAALAGLEFVA